MASIIVQNGRMSFKVDKGELKDGKAYLRTISMTGVKGDADPDALADVASKLEVILDGIVEAVHLVRNEVLVY